MPHVEFKAKSTAITGKIRGHLAKALGGRDKVIVIDVATTQAYVNASHYPLWCQRLAKDLSATVARLRYTPTGLKSSYCGYLFASTTVLRRHQSGRCKICRTERQRLAGGLATAREYNNLRTATQTASIVKTIISVKGLADFSLNGMISVLRQREDEAMRIAQAYSTAAESLIRLEAAEAELTALQARISEDRKGVQHFLEEEEKS